MSIESTFLEVLKGDICLSGGAKGADAQWGMNAGRDGQSVIHWSFQGHRHFVSEQEVVRLTDEQLIVGDTALEKASRKIKRPWPGKRSKNVKSLLRRNWYQVAWSESLYAVSTIKPCGKLVDGGTGWAVQMFLDRFEKKAGFEPLQCFVYDQKAEQWFQWIGEEFKPKDLPPPKPSGIWAGIGTRDLNDSGKWAIRNLFGWSEDKA